MSAGALNALNYYGNMQRSQNTLNSIQNPAVVNPLQDLTSAMQTAAMIKYLRGGTQAQTQLPRTAMSGSIDMFGNAPTANANALNAGAAGASAAPATASSGTAVTPAAAQPASSPTSSSGSSLNGALNSILSDPSDAGIHTAMTSLYGTYGRAADLARNDLLSMSVDQRRSFAQQQLASMNAATAGTTTATS